MATLGGPTLPWFLSPMADPATVSSLSTALLEGGSLVMGALLAGGVGVALDWYKRKADRKDAVQSLVVALEQEFALLAELGAEQDKAIFTPILEHGQIDGVVYSPSNMAQFFDEDPALAAPVFYANKANLGLLDQEILAPMLRYHTFRAGLMRSAKILFASHGSTPRGQIQLTARQMRPRYEEMVAARKLTLKNLTEFLKK